MTQTELPKVDLDVGRPPKAGSKPGTVRHNLQQFAAPAGSLLVIAVLAWELAARLGAVSEFILPAPSSILQGFAQLFVDGLVWEHLYATMLSAAIGFGVGAGGAIVLAMLASLSNWFRRTVYPYAIILYVTPNIALAPLYITWFGFGLAPKVVMAATIVFFPVFVNTLTGLITTDRDALELFRSLGATKLQIFARLTLPSALPITFAGLKTGVTLALIGALVAEFVSTAVGLGLLLDEFTFALDMPSAFAVILLLALLGLILYAIMEYADSRVIYWRSEARIVRKQRRQRTKRIWKRG